MFQRRMNMRSKAFRQSWTRVTLPPNNDNPLAALYNTLLPAKACGSRRTATDEGKHRSAAKLKPNCTGSAQHPHAIINMEAVSTMHGAGRAAASPAPCGRSAGSAGAVTAAPLERPPQATAASSTTDMIVAADYVCEGALPGGSSGSSGSFSSRPADRGAPLAGSAFAAAPQVAGNQAETFVGRPQTGVLTQCACCAAVAKDTFNMGRARELEQVAVKAMRAYGQAWGAEEVGDDFFEWLDLASSAGTAVFLDVVLEAHRLGDDQLQRFIDYFGQGPAAELLGLVTEALLQSKIARNADFAVMLGEAHMDALGEDTYTKLMQDYVALGGPQPEPRLSDSLGGVLGDNAALHHSSRSSSCSSLSSLNPGISLSVPTGHWRLTASSQDASHMRLGAMPPGSETGAMVGPPALRSSTAHDLTPSSACLSTASDAANVLQQPAQDPASASVAALPLAASSAPTVTSAGGQQAAMRPVVPRLDLSKVAAPHSPEPSYVPAEARSGRRIKKLLKKVVAAICCKKPKVVL